MIPSLRQEAGSATGGGTCASPRKNVRLPFEGDDMLSIIISKAFMLAGDDKIKDASIRSQIAHSAAGARPA
jgi:hypothetical protein